MGKGSDRSGEARAGDTRAVRLKAALKANLARRKAQARAREEERAADPATDGAGGDKNKDG